VSDFIFTHIFYYFVVMCWNNWIRCYLHSHFWVYLYRLTDTIGIGP